MNDAPVPVPALPRTLALEGASNVRDLGGWPTAQGGRVRFGAVYRSASLARLTTADAARLTAAGIRRVVDLRGEKEREEAPSRLGTIQAEGQPIAPTVGASLRDILARRDATGEDVASVMRQAYRAYALEAAPSYRRIVDLVLAGDGAVLFHCTAGKDRTGFGAALLLAAIGVEQGAIREDYLATNRLWKPDPAVAASMPPAVAAVLLSADLSFLDAAFAAIHEAHGTVDAYLAARLGLDAARREALRARLVE